MPRRARLAVPGIPWHIIQRGNNRSACFYTDEDYRCYLETRRDQAQIHGCAIHVYVLMTNHVHLLLTPERKESAACMMKQLGQRYVQYVNRTYRRSGTLWEGRFKSCLAQNETYVLTCHRYIELNTVRAGMVPAPANYRWSSYRANGLGKTDVLVRPHEQYLRLGNAAEERMAAYRALFSAHLEPDQLSAIRQATNGNYALGDRRSQAEIERMLERRATPGKSGRPRRREGGGT